MNFPRVLPLLGLNTDGRWFIDSAAILAASDAVRTGTDPWLPNPLDAYGRPHCYSGWWLGLAATGLTREDNFLLGSLWGAAVLGSAFLLLRPASVTRAAVVAAALLSPPVLLAVNRANNDLVVFAVLVAGLGWLKQDTAPRSGAFAGAVAIATGLKFYPIVAAAAFLLRKPTPRAWRLTLMAGLAG
ncbi:MAG: glycosyltransferase 87 family protein, partial [Opitutaceae bacterium]